MWHDRSTQGLRRRGGGSRPPCAHGTTTYTAHIPKPRTPGRRCISGPSACSLNSGYIHWPLALLTKPWNFFARRAEAAAAASADSARCCGLYRMSSVSRT